MADSNPRSERAALEAALPALGDGPLDLALRYSSETFVRKGRALYYQGDDGTAAFLVLEGRIRPLRLKGGFSTPMEELGRGAWLGLAEAYLGLPFMADALAVEASALRRFSRYNLGQLLRDAAFKDLAIAALARESCRLHGALDAANAIERLARAIAARADAVLAESPRPTDAPAGATTAAPAVGRTVGLRCTQAELAEAAGLSRETANRCLRRLEAAGLLETGRYELLVYDVPGLRGFESD